MKVAIALTALSALAASGTAVAYDLENWPTKFKTDSGLELGVKGLYQFDAESFSDDELPNGTSRFAETQAWRREEFSAYLKKDGAFELTVGFDFAPIKRNWIDNYVKIFTKKHGTFRFGQFKTPVAYDESAYSSGATLFLERALPAQAVYEDRRFGADWTYEGAPRWLFNVGYFGFQDLHGDNDGETIAGRVVFNPIKDDATVVHLGAAASREDRDDEVARIRAKPEANVTPIRLVDTGNLASAEHIDRYGLEGAWRSGPWMVQAEVLGIDVARGAGRPDFSGGGFYVSAAYLLTGESHPYKGGVFANPKPKRSTGAFELAARYSEVDLDDGAIAGGRQHDFTFGANWYLGSHVKLQGNYVVATSDRGPLSLDPRILEFRAQVQF